MNEDKAKILQDNLTKLSKLEEERKKIEKVIDTLSNEDLYNRMEALVGKYFKYSSMDRTEIYKVLDVNKKYKQLVVFSMTNNIMLIGWSWGSWSYGTKDYKEFTGTRLKEITKEEFDKEAHFLIDHELIPYIDK